jgi:D-amino-acid oxidase
MSSSALLSGVLPLSHRRVTARRRRQHVVVASWSSADATPPVGTRKPVASVVGAGIVGLTTALRLQEAGFDVTVTHAEDEHDLVSHGSGGFWFPYLVENMDRVGPWAKATYDTFLSEMRASPFTNPGASIKTSPGASAFA